MEPGGSMPHSQGLSNNSYPEPNQTQLPALIPISSRSILILSSHLCLGLPKGLFPVGLPVKTFESTPTFLYSSYMTCSSQPSRFNHRLYRRTVQTMKFLTFYYRPILDKIIYIQYINKFVLYII